MAPEYRDPVCGWRCAQVVGRDDFSDYPPQRKIATIGGRVAATKHCRVEA
jgi:hypothetical protein